jgi:hypothetical protein
MIASALMGATMLGELWYGEADRPERPWVHARSSRADKPGDAHDFYKPHPAPDPRPRRRARGERPGMTAYLGVQGDAGEKGGGVP